MGVFVSGYYNGGWIGLSVISLVCGMILRQISYLSRVIVETGSHLLYPFVLFGVYMAFRIDGHFLDDLHHFDHLNLLGYLCLHWLAPNRFNLDYFLNLNDPLHWHLNYLLNLNDPLHPRHLSAYIFIRPF